MAGNSSTGELEWKQGLEFQCLRLCSRTGVKSHSDMAETQEVEAPSYNSVTDL